MPNTAISGLTSASALDLTEPVPLVQSSATKKAGLNLLLGMLQRVADGRLTTESGVAVSSADRASQSTLYYTPYSGTRIALYDGTNWKLHTFAERSLALSGLTADRNYDVFLYDNSGTLTLELSAAWNADGVTRTDALATQNGITVKSGATTRRWLGTIRTTGTTTTEDSESKRFVWNVNNQVRRRLMKYQGAGTEHTYATATFREWNGGTGGPHRVYFVSGEVGDVDVSGWSELKGDGTRVGFNTVGINDATVEGLAVNSNQVNNFLRLPLVGEYVSRAGFNELIVVEYSTGATASFNYYRLMAKVPC